MAATAATRYSLVRRLKDPADAVAWTEFVAIYEPFLKAVAKQHGLQDADAADLCQDLFATLARQAASWRDDCNHDSIPGAEDGISPQPADKRGATFVASSGRGSFRGYLYRMARNRVIDWTRGRRRDVIGTGRTSVHAQLAEAPERSASGLDRELRRRVFHWAAAKVRSEVTEGVWQAFWLTGIGRQPPVAVARQLGMTVGAIYVARSRILARIRAKIEEVSRDTGFFAEVDDDPSSHEM